MADNYVVPCLYTMHLCSTNWWPRSQQKDVLMNRTMVFIMVAIVILLNSTVGSF